jgi:hypothetical protein
MATNKIYRQGVDKVAQAHRGLRDHYRTFFEFKKNPYPFSLYHGVDIDTAYKLLDCRHAHSEEEMMRRIHEITSKARYYRKRWAKGGRNSAKTYTAAYVFLCLMAYFENNLGIMLRHSWRTVDTTMLREFMAIANVVTDGNPGYLLRQQGRKKGNYIGNHTGYKDFVVFTAGVPSYILVLPEPDEADPRAVADALKSPEGGLGAYWIDELSEVREVVDSTLEDNLRRKGVPKAGIATTNPFIEGTWGYRQSRDVESRQAMGEPPRLLILPSSMYDNPFADEDNIKAMEDNPSRASPSSRPSLTGRCM